VSSPSIVAVWRCAAGPERDRDPFHNVIIASHTAQLLVYRETTLLWSARNHMQPVALAVAQFGCVASLACRCVCLHLSMSACDRPSPSPSVGGWVGGRVCVGL
jgi:hypothetical protein